MENFTKWAALIGGAFSPLLKEFVIKHERVVWGGARFSDLLTEGLVG